MDGLDSNFAHEIFGNCVGCRGAARVRDEGVCSGWRSCFFADWRRGSEGSLCASLRRTPTSIAKDCD